MRLAIVAGRQHNVYMKKTDMIADDKSRLSITTIHGPTDEGLMCAIITCSHSAVGISSEAAATVIVVIILQ